MTEKNVLIAGGGIGGLTAAACLLQRGIDVDVYEQADELGEVGAGIQVSANASRVYQHIGILDDLVEAGSCPEAYRFRLFDSGEVLQTIPLGSAYVRRHGVPYVSVHRADLHRLLVERVTALKPDAIHLGVEVTGFEELQQGGVTLRFADGGCVTGRALLGADGIKSAVRRQIVGAAPVTYTGDASWRVVVESENVAEEHRQRTVDIWVGPGKHAVTYPMRGDRLINLVGCVEHDEWDEESWVASRPWHELKEDFQGWHPSIGALIDAADRDHCYRWAMNNRPPVENWTSGHATLLGDAAHPTLPYMAQGAAMAVEDAAVLARALEAEPRTDEALRLYQRNRIERTTRIVNESSSNRRLFHLNSTAELREEFAKRDISSERSAWLFSYDPVRVDML
ncbi:FAD-dependent monooxygenase [Alloalcanivorax sp. C16-2]|uniref:FAD-dependent monooxygenase n=1 Tax=Alloalcanivorax sp. C16-2 TaxID=3390052 RepID=UPI0039706A9C